MVLQICDFDGERQYSHALRLASELADLRAENANLGPTGYTPCEYAAFVGNNDVVVHRSAMHSRSNLRAARLCVAQTRSRLIM